MQLETSPATIVRADWEKTNAEFLWYGQVVQQ